RRRRIRKPRRARGYGIAGLALVRDRCVRTHHNKLPRAGVARRFKSTVVQPSFESLHCSPLPRQQGQCSSSVHIKSETAEARVGRDQQRFGQRRVFSFARADSLLDRQPGNRKILAPPVSPESATFWPERETDRSRLSLTTTAGGRCLT